MKPKQYRGRELGFTLVEIMVVVSIIAFLAASIVTAVTSARQKARDARRAADLGQMLKAMELYFDTNRGFPGGTVSGATQVPTDMDQFVATLPVSPEPADSGCTGTVAPSPATDANSYYYQPLGTPYTSNGKTVYPDYRYYFCIGGKTGDLNPGVHFISPAGMQ
jgi:prepilin-type N-terminal cleavage/methylation domain-containing protein